MENCFLIQRVDVKQPTYMAEAGLNDLTALVVFKDIVQATERALDACEQGEPCVVHPTTWTKIDAVLRNADLRRQHVYAPGAESPMVVVHFEVAS